MQLRTKLMTIKQKIIRSPKPSVSIYIITSLVVGLAFLGVTVWSWKIAKQTLGQQLNSSAKQISDSSTDAIVQRLATYEEILRGGAGLFKASDNVTRLEWKEFIDTYDSENLYPGAQGFGFVGYITPDQLASHIASVRTDSHSDYTLFPEGERPIYTPVVYLAPETESNQRAIGYDMSSEATRRAAMFLARDIGQTTISSSVQLIQDKDLSPNSGFLMYYPIYRNNMPLTTATERAQALEGFTYAPFRIRNLLSGVFGGRKNPNAALKIYDGPTRNEKKVMFKSGDFDSINAHNPILVTTQKQINHHTWTFVYAVSEKIIPARERQRPIATIISGIIFSAIITAFLLQLLTSRARSLIYNKQREVQTAKDELLSLASHQLRTPATGVKQYVGMLLEGYVGTLTKQQTEMLQKAYISNERQLDIINQILYVARADSGRILLNKQSIDLKELMEQVINEQMGSIVSKNQKISFKKPRTNILVHADKQYLHMALDNVLNNASKYTHDNGKISVTVSKVNNEAVVSIEDSGVGIEPKNHQQIFEKFTRLDNDLSTQVGGSGIGLYLCQQIIELHGGRITLESAADVGSIFTIYLPFE